MNPNIIRKIVNPLANLLSSFLHSPGVWAHIYVPLQGNYIGIYVYFIHDPCILQYTQIYGRFCIIAIDLHYLPCNRTYLHYLLLHFVCI